MVISLSVCSRVKYGVYCNNSIFIVPPNFTHILYSLMLMAIADCYFGLIDLLYRLQPNLNNVQSYKFKTLLRQIA